MARWPRPAPFTSATIVLLVLSAAVNALQAQRIRGLVSANPSTPSVIGQTVPSIAGLSVTGRPREVSLRTDLPTVVYFFSPACIWCERNWPNIQALASGAAGRYRVLAVSTARDVTQYLAANHVTIDVLAGIGENTRRDLGLLGTPTTVVVSNDGLITHVWRGAFTPRLQRQMEDLFGVVLPGLPQTPVDRRSAW